MKISIETQNCDFKNSYLIEGSAESKVRLILEFQNLVSVQSKKKYIDELFSEVQSELSKFEWICAGKVQIEFTWFLNSVKRQETAKMGDLDNITKPLIDSLSGINGLFIDDAQINSICTCWMTRKQLNEDNLVYIDISIFNDWVLPKKNLYFIQYDGAICTPLNIDISSKRDLFSSKLFIKARKMQRSFARNRKKAGVDLDRYLVYSEYDFHKTRLSGIPKSQILRIEELNLKCSENGLTFRELIKNYRKRLACR